MKHMTLEIAYTDDDEEFDVVANGVIVGSFSNHTQDHDTLLSIRDMILAIGDRFGITVEMTGGSDED